MLAVLSGTISPRRPPNVSGPWRMCAAPCRRTGLVDDLGVAKDARGNVATKDGATSVPGVFAAGDMARSQSLVGWATAEGRRVARSVDELLAAPTLV